jgi:hypothetical protein
MDLKGAELGAANLAGADLQSGHLEDANLRYSHLEGAVLIGALLEDANLEGAHLEGAVLTLAHLDAKTIMRAAKLLEEKDPRRFWQRLLRRPRYGPALGDINWRDFDLMQITQLKGWSQVRRLADERGLHLLSDLDDHERAIRAYRQVAARLRDQGANSDADRLSERAQICQRRQALDTMTELQATRGKWTVTQLTRSCAAH